jgi:hypothetical protein
MPLYGPSSKDLTERANPEAPIKQDFRSAPIPPRRDGECARFLPVQSNPNRS